MSTRKTHNPTLTRYSINKSQRRSPSLAASRSAQPTSPVAAAHRATRENLSAAELRELIDLLVQLLDAKSPEIDRQSGGSPLSDLLSQLPSLLSSFLPLLL
jgi:hypothetical protein